MSNKISYTEQPTDDPLPEQNGPSMTFWGIGIVINVVMITAYFVWAYKQWKKIDRRDN
ncbi:MAG: hypothetical protein GY935_15970 [Gammaproteobacteria bacterium]|nr:hypothetical protein [Gammaproteobacteria bacterium]